MQHENVREFVFSAYLVENEQRVSGTAEIDGRNAEHLIARHSRNGNGRIEDGPDPRDCGTVRGPAPPYDPVQHARRVEIMPYAVDDESVDLALRIVKTVLLRLDVLLGRQLQFLLRIGCRHSGPRLPRGGAIADDRDGLCFIAPRSLRPFRNGFFEHRRRRAFAVGHCAGAGGTRGGGLIPARAPAARRRGEESAVAAEAGKALLDRDGAEILARCRGLLLQLPALLRLDRAGLLRVDLGGRPAIKGKGLSRRFRAGRGT